MISKRLARLVRVKKLMESARSAELAESQASLDQAQDALTRTYDDLRSVDQAQSGNTPSVDELSLAATYQGHLEEQLDSQADIVIDRTHEVEFSLDRVTEVYRERRLMENVHDRTLEEERVEQSRADRKKYDDLALKAHHRRSTGEPK